MYSVNGHQHFTAFAKPKLPFDAINLMSFPSSAFAPLPFRAPLLPSRGQLFSNLQSWLMTTSSWAFKQITVVLCIAPWFTFINHRNTPIYTATTLCLRMIEYCMRLQRRNGRKACSAQQCFKRQRVLYRPSVYGDDGVSQMHTPGMGSPGLLFSSN